MKLRIIAAAVGWIALGLFAMFWPGLLKAQSGLPSRCGAEASGLRADGVQWAGAAPRMFVGRDGYWHICQPWVPDGGDPEMKDPGDRRPCLPRETYETWAVNGNVCSSLPPGAYTGNTARLPFGEFGRPALIMDEWGNERGMAVFRCTATGWQLEPPAVCDSIRLPDVVKPRKRK